MFEDDRNSRHPGLVDSRTPSVAPDGK